MSPTGLGSLAGVTAFSRVQKSWRGHLLWVFVGAVLGLAVAMVFAGFLHLPRPVYLVAYVSLVGAYLYGYARWSEIDLGGMICHHLVWGLAGGIVVGLLVVQSVLRQPSSPAPGGFELMFDLLWLGLVYGTVDGLFLSVMPVLAIREGTSRLGWTLSCSGRLGVGILALAASLMVTAAYHIGYPEFRGPQVMLPMLGVGLMSLAYLITANPLSAVISHVAMHVAMHVATVLHGFQTAVQLPPHY